MEDCQYVRSFMVVYESRLNSVTGLFSGANFSPEDRGKGRVGVFRKVWCIKTSPPPQKKITYENCTAPLAKTIFKMHPLQPLLDQVFVFILGH